MWQDVDEMMKERNYEFMKFDGSKKKYVNGTKQIVICMACGYLMYYNREDHKTAMKRFIPGNAGMVRGIHDFFYHKNSNQ